MMDTKNKSFHDLKIIALSSVGGIIEFYDFSIFILLSPYIAQNFFTGSEFLRLMETYSIFAIGYIARPIGGTILAHFGDKRGRKTIFLLSIFSMAFATLFIGLIPNYNSIGVLAPILLIITRFVQGFALGAEIPGAFTFVYEHMPLTKKFLGIAIIISGIYFGIALGSFISMLVGNFFSTIQIESFGWRIPFIFGGFLAFVGFFMRFGMTEPPEFAALKKEGGTHKVPLFEVVKNHKLSFLIGVVLTTAFGTVMVFFYSLLPSYLITKFNYDHLRAFRISTYNTLSLALLLIILGFICTRGKNKLFTMLSISMLAIVGCSALVMYSIIEMNSSNLLFYLLLLSIFVAVGNPAYNLAITELFPIKIRYSGVATTLNVANAIVGGATPLAITWLSYKMATPFAPAYYIAVICIAGVIAALLIPIHMKNCAKKGSL